MDYTRYVNMRRTPQSEAIPGSDQVANSAGGFSYAADNWKRLTRFLVLGTEGGTYYIDEKKLTKENATALFACLKEDPRRTVKEIVSVSKAGRAPKNDAAIFALAIASADEKAKDMALAAIPEVCRTGTHLFQFVEAVQSCRGWGRALRRAVGAWYTEKPIERLAYQLVKYRQRNGWTHRDVLRLAHPKSGPAWSNVMRFAVKGEMTGERLLGGTAVFGEQLIDSFLEIQKAKTVKDAVRVLRNNTNLPWETIPTELLGDKEIWAELLPRLPYTALIRNLGRMTANGLLVPFSDAATIVAKRLAAGESLREARVHPLNILVAARTYAAGRGLKGSLAWKPVGQVTDALDDAFYSAFDFVEPSGKAHLLGLDVSGSMQMGQVCGCALTPIEAEACMAMVTARREPRCEMLAFSTQVVPFNITAKARLVDVVKAMKAIPMGGTDCSVPMLVATSGKWEIDQFVVYTDSETWAGRQHPSQALNEYRRMMNRRAKLAVVAMTSNGFTIADPKDPDMLDVVGFDTATPAVLREFALA